ncbi:MAG: malate dehydrogenase [bacterium]|nr:malate dehydrogenase [bacterium]
MQKVSIIGSGNVGVNSAFFIAEMAAAHIMLIDIKEGMSHGKALDLMEAAPIRQYRTKIEGSHDIKDIKDSDVVVITAGLIRAPGRDRGEHFQKNVDIIKGLCKSIVELAPNSTIIVATEPVDAMVMVICRETGFDRKRVMGIGGLLDSTRMAHFVAEKLNVSPRDITALVIGSHTRLMLPLPFYSRINGIEAGMLLSAEDIEEVVTNTRDAGSVIVDLAKRSNAYYAPSAAIAQVVEAICIDTKKVLSMSIMLAGEYGLEDVALSVPCKVGANGIEEIIELDLKNEDLQALAASAEPIRSYF